MVLLPVFELLLLDVGAVWAATGKTMDNVRLKKNILDPIDLDKLDQLM
jgi:hypothetical protein